MHNCGGDIFAHGDNNRWTDNKIGTEDDRLIQTKPVSPIGQYNFIAAEAMAARLTREGDPDYSKKSLDAALRCFAWCQTGNAGKNAGELGSAIEACLELDKTLGEAKYRKHAVEYAKRLLSLQITQQIDDRLPVRGFFMTSTGSPQPYRDIFHGCLHLIGLCDLLASFPDDADAPLWRSAIQMYCQDYLLAISEQNSFGIVPFGFYGGEDPGGNRRVGNYWYRFFMEPNRSWWVGINSNLASAGVGLIKAARILKEPRLAALAQRQLDWILGVNPFDASTVESVGYNQPKQFVTSEFRPATPHIPGAVMNGIGGTTDDQPDLKPGAWQTCEYWTPMVCYTMWLMAEIQRGM